MLTLVVFAIVAPRGAGTRGVALALEGAALLVAVATSRARRAVRQREAAVGGLVALAVVGGAGTGAIPAPVALALDAALAVAIPAALVGGLLRLIRERGVTLQAVAGALAIYVLIGILFASAISFVAHVDSTPYYAQGVRGSEADHVYFSFTVLTTTGLGDLTAATRLGRALAVVEMLVGQLYLVTVIGLLVGSYVARARS